MINKQSYIMNRIMNKESHITGSNITIHKQSHIMIINKQSHITGS